MTGRTLGQYSIVKLIGKGGMGEVYLARDSVTNRKVALKFLPEEFLGDTAKTQRFLNEAKIASSLDHPNICKVYHGSETDKGELYICMEYYKGCTVDEMLKNGLMKLSDSIQIALQVARGLSAAHEKDIIHRDIKASNILVTVDGVAKILDFGLAKFVDGTPITTIGTRMGTIDYMSPEQVHGIPVDHRTDIWSLGVLMYEMATGTLPFKNKIPMAVMESIVSKDPQPVHVVNPDIPIRISAVITMCLQKNRDDRYAGFHQFLTDLEKVIETETLESRPMPIADDDSGIDVTSIINPHECR